MGVACSPVVVCSVDVVCGFFELEVVVFVVFDIVVLDLELFYVVASFYADVVLGDCVILYCGWGSVSVGVLGGYGVADADGVVCD